MTVPMRISADLAREKSMSGSTLLVCAHEDADQFHTHRLEGAITWQRFESRLAELPKDQPIIFYCASTAEASAAGRAETVMGQGFSNVKVLGGGVDAWKRAGLPLVIDYQI